MNHLFFITSFILLVLITGCEQEVTLSLDRDVASYLHIAHTRTNANPAMDSLAEQIDYAAYDMLWLGGDMAFETSGDDETMTYIDNFFDLGNPRTLWSLGNHDYASLNRVQAYTNRPPYYTSHHNGITFLVLDTQDSMCHIAGAQKDLFDQVVDTIQASSHLVVLHHKLIWMYGNPILESQIDDVSNGGLGDCFYCINPNNFYTDLYPSLLAVKDRGIQVVCIAGDIGFKVNAFEYITPEGIYFLASGIQANRPDNQALVFHHYLPNGELTWLFEPLGNLVP